MSPEINWGKQKVLEAVEYSTTNYLSLFESIFKNLALNNYLEIGTNTGDSIRYSNCSVNICIDPSFSVSQNIIKEKKHLLLFQETSDLYFKEFHSKYFNNDFKIDIAFIDGLHHGNQVLKDFHNVEKICSKNAVIIFHDVLPRTIETSRRKRVVRSWTGDVWKAIHILKEHRKDLKFNFLDASQSGLLLVQNINANSNNKIEVQLEAIKGIENQILRDYLEKIDVYSSDDFNQQLNSDKSIDFSKLRTRKLKVVYP